ncbi:TPA: DUF551 domain-containing protein [Klebsiella pneumoniae]|nr:DUF551 domain-containing protein [Klebsiella pneumoniae]
MTKPTITRERARQIFLGNGPELSASEERELARMALAAMDSEPVAYIDKQWTLVYYVPPMSMGLKIGDKLYRHAQPAPVSYSDFEEFWSAYIHPLAQDDELKDFSWGIWNACVSNSQPAPVVPDGYVMVPKEMTDEIGEAIAMQANCCGGIALDIYDAMLAAAPHDTPALNSVQSVVTVPGKWIPVSERMPDNTEPVLCIEKRADFGTYGQPFVCWHDGDGWVGKTNYRPIVTHWMPLPAAPQEVK